MVELLRKYRTMKIVICFWIILNNAVNAQGYSEPLQNTQSVSKAERTVTRYSSDIVVPTRPVYSSRSSAIKWNPLQSTEQPESNGFFDRQDNILIIATSVGGCLIFLVLLFTISIICWKRRLKKRRKKIETYFTVIQADDFPNTFSTNGDVNPPSPLKLIDSIPGEEEERNNPISFKTGGFTNRGYCQSPTDEILLVEEDRTAEIPDLILHIVNTDKKDEDTLTHNNPDSKLRGNGMETCEQSDDKCEEIEHHSASNNRPDEFIEDPELISREQTLEMNNNEVLPLEKSVMKVNDDVITEDQKGKLELSKNENGSNQDTADDNTNNDKSENNNEIDDVATALIANTLVNTSYEETRVNEEMVDEKDNFEQNDDNKSNGDEQSNGVNMNEKKDEMMKDSIDEYSNKIMDISNTSDKFNEEESDVEENATEKNNKGREDNDHDRNGNCEDAARNEHDKIVVRFSHHASEWNELTVESGDSVVIIEQNLESGWSWVENENGGEQGWFPSHYLNITQEKEENESDICNVLQEDMKDEERSCHDFIVLYSYVASDDDELSLEKDNVVSIIQNNPRGWSFVAAENNTKAGWFPTCYLKELVSDNLPHQYIVKTQMSADDAIYDSIKDMGDGKPKLNFIVLHSHHASNTDEISLDKKMIVSIDKNVPSGWSWVTHIHHGSGWFPTCYLQPLTQRTASEPEQSQVSYLDFSKTNDVNETKEEFMYAYSEPHDVEALKQEGVFEEYEAVVYRASHSFEGADENELSFKENDPILVLEETESGWWRGSTHLGEGWFPVTHVQAIVESKSLVEDEYVDISNKLSRDRSEPHVDNIQTSNQQKTFEDEQGSESSDSTVGVEYVEIKHRSRSDNGEPSLLTEDDCSPYMVTDCFLPDSNTEKQEVVSATAVSKIKDKPKSNRRAPPRPPRENQKNDEQNVDQSNICEEEGVVIFRDQKVPKIIKITKRRSIVNPDNHDIGPPPSKPLPVRPSGKYKPEKPPPPDLEILRKKGYIVQRDSKTEEMCHTPEKPPPPTPLGLQIRRTYSENHTEDFEDDPLPIPRNSINGNKDTPREVEDGDKTSTTKPVPKARKLVRDRMKSGDNPEQLSNLESNEKIVPTSCDNLLPEPANINDNNQHDMLEKLVLEMGTKMKPKPKPRKK